MPPPVKGVGVVTDLAQHYKEEQAEEDRDGN